MTTTKRPPSKRGYKQGYYTPTHPEKYIGDPTKIRYLSSWELKMHKMLDNNPYVVRWASEEIKIPYIGVDNALHHYFPDYYVEYKVPGSTNVHREIIEVKPKKQTLSPNPKSKRYLEERVVYETNLLKWKSAAAWCKTKGIAFRLFTEASIF